MNAKKQTQKHTDHYSYFAKKVSFHRFPTFIAPK